MRGFLRRTRSLAHTCEPVWRETLMLCWDGQDALRVDIFSDEEHVGHAELDLTLLALRASGSDGDGDGAATRAAEIALAACGAQLIDGDGDGEADVAVAAADDRAATLAVWLPLGQRERATQHDRAEARLRANLKRAVRGSVMHPRAATGEIQLHLKFSPLTH